MAERLGVNIFSGVLPSSYLFVDDGSDNSKWDDGSVPFDSITPGDNFGYVDKGLRFSLNAAAFPVVAGAHRSVFFPFGTNACIIGLIIRPGIDAYLNPNYYSAGITDGRNCSIQVNYPISGGVNTGWFGISIEHKRGVVGGDDHIFNRISVGNALGSVIAVELHNEIDFAIPAISLPWLRIICTMINGSIVQTTVNNVTYPTLITPSSASPIRPGIIFYGGKNDSAVADGVYWDIDQIWISDTEYRI